VRALMVEKKKPRRTAERILEVTLELFNRFGEPNVSTTAISAELRIARATCTTTTRRKTS